MKTVWEYSLGTEAKRLIHCAHQIGIGFYKTNNFIVLPYTPNSNSAHTVTFPDLPYSKISRFWEKVKRIDITKLPIDADKELEDQVGTILNQANLTNLDYGDIKHKWEKSQNKVISQIYNVLPGKKNSIKEIVIYPTAFGTTTSFNWISDEGKIILYLREDQGIYAIVEAIITSLTREDVYNKLGGLWQESEIITDYLVTETSIATVLQRFENPNSYIPTLKGTRGKEQAKLTQESDNFYKKLGIPSFDKPFGYNGLVPELFGKPINNLTESEKKVLLTLIKNSNSVTRIDDIGSEIFKTEDDFSLYAISKTIQRLRDKLENNGISGSYIQTLRGKGYILKN